MKSFICDCTNPIWDMNELADIIDNAKEITRGEFLNACDVEEKIRINMIDFPNDYNYYKYKEIYFFVHSCIEYFYE